MFGKLRRRKDTNEERCFILADDLKFMGKALVTTGAFLVDKDNQWAYDITTRNMGVHIICLPNGRVINKEKCALLYETSPQPWDWEAQAWNKEVTNEKTLLQDGRMEAVGNISREQEEDEKWARFMPVLYGALAILALVAIIACASAGLFSKIGDVL